MTETLLIFFLLSQVVHGTELILEPSKWAFPSRCESLLMASDKEGRRDNRKSNLSSWRQKAIQAIRNGLNPNNHTDPQFAIIDMSPFLPKNLDAIAESLPPGMAALYSSREVQPGQYFDIKKFPNPSLDERLPPVLFEWSLKAMQFLSDLVREALEPIHPPGIFPKTDVGVAKNAVGGSSHTLTDFAPHADGNSMISLVFNAAGDVTTDYYPYRPRANDPQNGSRDTESRLGPPISAPRHSVILMPGNEWSYLGYGHPLYHKAPNRNGSRFAIIQFFDRL